MVKSEWIMANAGSGKTTALTARVVRLLLLGVPPERIVCITYTKAAASEMRARVLARLRTLLLADDAVCLALVTELLGHAPNDAQLARARSLFGHVLDSPTGGLQLTTIHGFCQTLLRRFPLEAEIAPHFTVLEDAAADELLRHAKHALLRDAEQDAQLADALALLGARGGESRFNTLTAGVLKNRALWRRVWHMQSPESLRAHLWALHAVAEDATPERLRADLLNGLRAEDEGLLRAALPELLAHKTKSYRDFAEKLAEWLAMDVPARAMHVQVFVQLFLTQKFTPRQYMLDKKQHPEGSPLAVVIANWLALVQHYHTQMTALACAEETYAIAIIARALEAHYALGKAAQHALDYDDLIEKTLVLVTRPEMIGWVMSKLDHRIDHLLVDEAQDNSAAQWQLAHVLVNELMVSNDGVGSANLPRSLLVVGDEKQSIYSFQGAAPQEFSRYHGIFKRMFEDSPTVLEDKTIANSYRSTQSVLQLVDAVCASPAIARAISSTGQLAPHRLIREGDAGLVTLYPPVITPEKEDIPALTIPLDYSISTSATQLLADEIAATIEHWLKEKRVLPSKGRAIEAGDILILVRNRTRLVQTLIRTLQRKDIPVAGMDRLTLADHLAVADLLALMRWCVNVADDLALAQVLRSPLVGMTDDDLRAIAHGREGMLWARVANPWLAEIRALTALSPYDFLTHVLEVSNCRHAFARRFGEEVHEVLDELKAQAAAMPQGMPQTLAQFYAWMAGSSRQIKREQEATSGSLLRIMTVHGAKGLEAPIVIMADTVEVPTTQRETVFSLESSAQQPLVALSISEISKFAPRLIEAKDAKKDAILAEYYRLLYVALTRARDELHVFGTASKKGDVKEGSWYAVIAAAMRQCGAQKQGEALQLMNPQTLAKPAPQALTSHAATQPLPAWATVSPALEVSPVATLSLSRLEVAAPVPYALAAGADARERGVRIHRMLELLSAQSDSASIAKLARYLAPDWDETKQLAMAAQVQALFDQERWLWAHKRMAEVNVSGSIQHQGTLISVTGQIDLLIEKEDEVVILDYKTGASIPADPSEVSISYVLQLKLYHALVSQIYPTLPIRCGIVWTHGPRLMWLDEVVQTTEFPDKNVMLKIGIAA